MRTNLFQTMTMAGLAWAASGLPALADTGYLQTNLVASDASYNPTFGVDPNVINPWGIALRPPGAGGHIWLSNAGTGTTTTYIGDANGVPLFQDGLKVIPIITSARDMDLFETGSDQVANVTGQVYNAASDIPGQPVEFPVSGHAVNFKTDPPTSVGIDSGSSKFVFVTLDGTINAWRTGTNPAMVEAVVIKDYSQNYASIGLDKFPSYAGVGMTTDAFTTDGQGNKIADNRLYAADFANGRIQVFDNQWNDITEPTKFQRPADLPITYHPFNVQVLSDNRVYVVWAENALEIDDPTEEIPGPGFGRVVAYDRHGNMLQDYSQHSTLNAPWGIAIAPSDFGPFSNALLVANFGDGTIAGFDLVSGAELGYLKDPDGNVISIEGIWGLTFGNGVMLGDLNALYFTAGVSEERNGLFGSLRIVPEPASLSLLATGGMLLIGRRRRI